MLSCFIRHAVATEKAIRQRIRKKAIALTIGPDSQTFRPFAAQAALFAIVVAKHQEQRHRCPQAG